MTPQQRVLIVEDDDAIRILVETVLRRRGYDVETARNGVEALDQMHAAPFALVILDLMMPRMSGYEVLEQLGAQPLRDRPLVLVLTAGIDVRPFDKTLVVGTIHKPFDLDLLVDVVRGCLTTTAQTPATQPEAPIDEFPPPPTRPETSVN
jgi:DNA-binding response OmpR family regulator